MNEFIQFLNPHIVNNTSEATIKQYILNQWLNKCKYTNTNIHSNSYVRLIICSKNKIQTKNKHTNNTCWRSKQTYEITIHISESNDYTKKTKHINEVILYLQLIVFDAQYNNNYTQMNLNSLVQIHKVNNHNRMEKKNQPVGTQWQYCMNEKIHISNSSLPKCQLWKAITYIN